MIGRRGSGRHEIRHLGDETAAYCQLLVADSRQDVAALLWEHLLGPGWEIDLRAVPRDLAEGYSATTCGAVTASDHATSGCVQLTLDPARSVPESDLGSVRTVTDPAVCLDLIFRPLDGVGWGMGVPGSRTAAFFASAVDASLRSGRMTLHLEDRLGSSTAGVLVLHGAGTSAVWRCAGPVVEGSQSHLVEAVTMEAARRGSGRIVWPDSVGVKGEQFPLSDLSRSRPTGSMSEKLTGFARRTALSYRSSP